MGDSRVRNTTAVNDIQTLKEINQYLLLQHPKNRLQVLDMMGKYLNVDMRAIVLGTVAGLPFGIAAKLTLFVVRTILNRSIYSAHLYMLPAGITTFSPDTDPDNYVGYLLYTWKATGTPSFQLKWD